MKIIGMDDVKTFMNNLDKIPSAMWGIIEKTIRRKNKK